MKGEKCKKQNYRNKNTIKLKVKIQEMVTIIMIPEKINGYI